MWKNEDGGSDEAKTHFFSIKSIYLSDCTLDFHFLSLKLWPLSSHLPDIGVEARKINIENGRMVSEQFVKVSLGEYILLFVQILTHEEEGSISLGHTCNIRF